MPADSRSKEFILFAFIPQEEFDRVVVSAFDNKIDKSITNEVWSTRAHHLLHYNTKLGSRRTFGRVKFVVLIFIKHESFSRSVKIDCICPVDRIQ